MPKKSATVDHDFRARRTQGVGVAGSSVAMLARDDSGHTRGRLRTPKKKMRYETRMGKGALRMWGRGASASGEA